MKSLNVESSNILNKMVSMLEDFCVRIDNSEGAFMAVYVAIYKENLENRIISVGHYTSSDGDITADPEMRFIYDETEDVYSPSYYRQDCIEVEQESIKIVRGKIVSVNRTQQELQTAFANHWLRNIKDQQNL